MRGGKDVGLGLGLGLGHLSSVFTCESGANKSDPWLPHIPPARPVASARVRAHTRQLQLDTVHDTQIG